MFFVLRAFCDFKLPIFRTYLELDYLAELDINNLTNIFGVFCACTYIYAHDYHIEPICT